MKILYYPINLDLEKVIKSDTILNQTQKDLMIKYYDRILYPIHKIISTNRHDLTRDYYDSVELSSAVLNNDIFKSVLFSKVNIMDFYLRNNILEITKKYSNQYHKCTAYKLTEIYNNTKIKNHSIKDIELQKSISKTNHSNFNLTQKYIFENLKQLKLNTEGTIELLIDNINKKTNNNIIIYNYSSYLLCNLCNYININKLNTSFFENFNINYIDKFDYLHDIFSAPDIKRKINYWKVKITDWINGEYNQFVSKNSNRIFNNLSEIPRELRSCLYLDDGEQLCEIDIPNSQPFLLNIILKQNFDFNGDLFNDLYPDIQMYHNLTERGILYDYMIKTWGVNVDRDIFKKIFFRDIFYSDKKLKGYNKNFKKDFPNIYKFIQTEKKNMKNKKGNKIFATKLQKNESDFMIKNIGTKLRINKTWFVTVHDSIICRESDSIYIKNLMETEFNKLELYPKLKINIL